MRHDPPNRFLVLSCTATAILALAAGAALRAQQPAQAPALGVIVLRNGNVLTGSVQRSGGHYRIENAGAVLQVPAGQIEMACATLEEAYEQRRKHRVGNSADGHLELARWCLRHGLLAQAAREILDARTDDPGHPALRSLDLQLKQGLADEASRREREKNAQAVALAAHQQPAATEEFVAPERLIDPSAEAQEKFVRSIQPMLIHNCTTSGCHSANSSQQLKLDRWALEGSGIPALIRKNLDQVLVQVDSEDPPSSPLMRRARQAHGFRNKQLSTPLEPYQAALLLDWLNEAAGAKPEPETPADSAAPGALPGEEEPTFTDEMLDEAAKEMLGVRRPKTAFTPRDEFDPEIFNRQRAAAKVKKAPPADELPVDDDRIPDSIEFSTEPAAAEESADLPAEESRTDRDPPQQ